MPGWIVHLITRLQDFAFSIAGVIVIAWVHGRDGLRQDRTTPEAEFVYQVLTQSIGFVRSGAYYFWDPLTVAIAVDESLGTLDAQSVRVIEREGPESGATRLDESGSPVRITTAAAGERFKQLFLDVLNGRAPK